MIGLITTTDQISNEFALEIVKLRSMVDVLVYEGISLSRFYIHHSYEISNALYPYYDNCLAFSSFNAEPRA